MTIILEEKKNSAKKTNAYKICHIGNTDSDKNF